MIDDAARRAAAVLARRCVDDPAAVEEFRAQFGGARDPLIRAMGDALAFRGRRGQLWEGDYLAIVYGLIYELEKGASGATPKERPYPRAWRWGFAFFLLFALWFGVDAVQDGWEAWEAYRGTGETRTWDIWFGSITFVAGIVIAVFLMRRARQARRLYGTRLYPSD